MSRQRAATIAGLSLSILLLLGSAGVLLLGEDGSSDVEVSNSIIDPLLQEDGHDHRNASQHILSTPNIKPLGYNPLTEPGNAEVQVAESPDGRIYAYIAGWTEMHIVDVTDPENTTWMGEYYDPNTQVLDVKYIQYDGREYVVLQNQLVDPGAADPNVGAWEDPTQVTVTLVEVTDKEDPQWVGAWYDADHPSGPHNLYTHVIDGEWYIFVANPDYDSCDVGQGLSLIHI